MLASRVGKIVGESGGVIFGATPVSCHFATCWWILYDILSTNPTLQQYLDYFSNPKVFRGPEEALKATVPFAQKITRPINPGLAGANLTAGSVIMFVHDKGARIGHSCVATSTTDVGGYNQVNWFWTGEANRFSTHKSSELRWRSQNFPEDVESNILGRDQWCQLRWVDGEAAKRVVTQKYNQR